MFGLGQQQNQQNQPAQGTSIFGTGFGQPAQQQQAATNQAPATGGGLFGSTLPNASTTQPSGGLFGNNQAKPAGGLFGASTATNTAAPATGGLFGAQANQPQQQQATQPATGGLFGNTAPSAQATTGGLFGNQSTTTQPASGGLFGNTTGNTAQSGATGGLFGGQSATTNTNTAGTTLFGSTAQPTQQASGGLFGNTQQTQQPQHQQPSTLFGQGAQNQTQTQAPSIFGQTRPVTNLGLGTSTAPQAGATNQITDPSSISGSTKFNDLPEQLKKILENVDSAIQKQTHISQELQSRSLGTDPEKAVRQARQVAKVVIATTNTLSLDDGFVQDLKVKVNQAVQDAVITINIINGWSNPAQNGSFLSTYADFPYQYFTVLATQLRDRLQRYKVMVEQIERKLASAADREQFSPQVIAGTLRVQHQTFMTLAAKTAEINTQLERIKDVYRSAWRAQNGSARDPFDKTGNNVDGLSMSGLVVS